MALVNVKFHKDCVEWDLGVTFNPLQDIGSRGVITRSHIREMYLLKENAGVAIDIQDRNFKPLQASPYLGVWDCMEATPVEHVTNTNTELFELILTLYKKQSL